MENKIYLEEFLDKLSKMVENSNESQIPACIKYVENYKLQLTEVIDNELFRNSTMNFLDEIISDIENGK